MNGGILDKTFMDNFRKYNSPRNSTRGAVDGFVGPSQPASRTARRGSLAGTAKPSNRLDNFKRPEGYRPNAQSSVRTSGAPGPKTMATGRMDVQLPHSSAEKRGKAKTKKRKLIKVSAFVFVGLFLVGGLLFGNAFMKARKIFGGGGNAPALSASVDPTKLNGEGDGRVNVLLLGKGGPGHEAPDLTDTLLVASIDPVQKEASLLSIPRDMWARTDNGQSKINAVYANAKYRVLNQRPNAKDEAEKAGMAALETEIEDVAGIPIHYYVMVDFTAFEKAINTVGGIDINVSKELAVYERLYDHSAGRQYTLDVKEGKNTFDGKRALFYARSRQTSARGDFDRAERQRAVLIALKDKIMSAGTYGNPAKINSLIGDFGDNVRSNLSPGEVLRVYELMGSIESSKIGSVGLADAPNNFVMTDNINGQSIVRPRLGLFDYSEIHNFVRNVMKDGYIRKENASIAVYNGSTLTGLAAKRSEELKSYGYNITTVANAPTRNYSQTTLVDLTNGQKKFTISYLEKRLKVKSVTSMPDNTINPNGADFVIILGQNESAN